MLTLTLQIHTSTAGNSPVTFFKLKNKDEGLFLTDYSFAGVEKKHLAFITSLSVLTSHKPTSLKVWVISARRSLIIPTQELWTLLKF